MPQLWQWSLAEILLESKRHLPRLPRRVVSPTGRRRSRIPDYSPRRSPDGSAVARGFRHMATRATDIVYDICSWMCWAVALSSAQVQRSDHRLPMGATNGRIRRRRLTFIDAPETKRRLRAEAQVRRQDRRKRCGNGHRTAGPKFVSVHTHGTTRGESSLHAQQIRFSGRSRRRS